MPRLATFESQLAMTNASVQNITVADYFDQLDSHDWEYKHASGPAYFKGQAQRDAIHDAALEDKTLRAVRDAYFAFKRGERAKPTADEFINTNAANDSVALDTATVRVVGTDAPPANDSSTPSPLPPTRDELVKLVSDGRFFGIEFQKRDGTVRQMQARLGVTKHLRGGQKAYSDAAKGILTVFSTDARGYRSIRLDSILSLVVNGTTYAAI